jgi:BirA family biotin operon repressor/biotin-[acetyl-CoA-carboxylase] ligase
LTELSAEPDRVRHLVLGIGINVNMDRSVLPSGFRDQTTTLSAETGGKVDRTALLRELLRQLDHWYRRLQEDAAAVREAWTGLNVTLGKRVAVSGAAGMIEGTARAIDAEGRLVLSLDSGSTVQVAAGDVTIIKKA